MTDEESGSNLSSGGTFLLKGLGAYMAGMVLCVLLTPAEGILAGLLLWPFYLLFAILGVFLYLFYLTPSYTFGSVLGHWAMAGLILVPVILEVGGVVRRVPGLRRWRAVWIGFVVGFVGTLGVYFTAAASI